MSLPNRTSFSTADASAQIDRLREALERADAVLVGAGAGLSTAAGLTYSGARFEKYFSDFAQKYGIRDIYSGGFYPFESLEDYWALWSRHIYINRYDVPAGQPYLDLLHLVGERESFVLTTNVDHQFQIAGFDRARLFYTQGDYGLWQCAKACHPRTYDNESTVRRMVREQRDMRIPTELIPCCPVCSAPMTMNLRCDARFVEDEGWHAAQARYAAFVREHAGARLLLLELGVGFNTPGIIKAPFWRMAAENARATYACINQGEAVCPAEIAQRSICIDGDLAEVLARLRA